MLQTRASELRLLQRFLEIILSGPSVEMFEGKKKIGGQIESYVFGPGSIAFLFLSQHLFY